MTYDFFEKSAILKIFKIEVEPPMYQAIYIVKLPWAIFGGCTASCKGFGFPRCHLPQISTVGHEMQS